MSEFAFFRFMSLSLLSEEEKKSKDEIISVTEEVLDAQGIECDSKISKLSEEKIREILNEVRKRRRKAREKDTGETVEAEDAESRNELEEPIAEKSS
jgi:ribosomal protein S13